MGERKILEVFYDYNCPRCYMGTANTDRLKVEREIDFLDVNYAGSKGFRAFRICF